MKIFNNINKEKIKGTLIIGIIITLSNKKSIIINNDINKI